ncbi:MAG: 50S ribosomal protein L20 [Parcubacteria group bacterium]|nr:50S ribosomal protein L20 [Parcubacteria group bacterium]
MARVKRGKAHLKKRKKLLKKAKGYMWGRKTRIKLAKVAVLKAGKYAYRDRRTKKRVARGLWILKLNAALGGFGVSYSKFINMLKNKNIELDRKILADFGENHPKILKAIVKVVK